MSSFVNDMKWRSFSWLSIALLCKIGLCSSSLAEFSVQSREKRKIIVDVMQKQTMKSSSVDR